MFSASLAGAGFRHAGHLRADLEDREEFLLAVGREVVRARSRLETAVVLKCIGTAREAESPDSGVVRAEVQCSCTKKYVITSNVA